MRTGGGTIEEPMKNEAIDLVAIVFWVFVLGSGYVWCGL